MRAVLEFDLTDLGDRQQHHVAVHAADYFFTLWDLDGWHRGKMKYDELSNDTYDAYDITRKQIRYLMDEHGVDLEDLA